MLNSSTTHIPSDEELRQMVYGSADAANLTELDFRNAVLPAHEQDLIGLGQNIVLDPHYYDELQTPGDALTPESDEVVSHKQRVLDEAIPGGDVRNTLGEDQAPDIEKMLAQFEAMSVEQIAQYVRILGTSRSTKRKITTGQRDQFELAA